MTVESRASTTQCAHGRLGGVATLAKTRAHRAPGHVVAILPRGEVYSRDLTGAGWRSFSDIHGDVDMTTIDAPFLLEGL